MLPAVAQAAIAIEVRAGDAATRGLIAVLDHRPTSICLEAERAFLRRLDGSCRTPIAGLAALVGDKLHFSGEILLPDGSDSNALSSVGDADDAAAFGDERAATLIGMAGPEFMRKLQ